MHDAHPSELSDCAVRGAASSSFTSKLQSSYGFLCCHFNSTESLQLIYNEGRQGLSDVRGKAHEHKKVGVIEKFFS